MVNYVLDTDILIYLLQGREAVIKKLVNISDNALYTTIINHSELYFGAFNSVKIEKNLERLHALFKKISILPFCEETSCLYAELKANLKKAGKIVADLDLMIASISLKHKMTLVTNNMRHFSRIRNLAIENWLDVK